MEETLVDDTYIMMLYYPNQYMVSKISCVVILFKISIVLLGREYFVFLWAHVLLSGDCIATIMR